MFFSSLNPWFNHTNAALSLRNMQMPFVGVDAELL